MFVELYIHVHEHKWGFHTLVVTMVGTLWWFGMGQDGMGQDIECILAMTKAGTLWVLGEGTDGKLGHNNENSRRVLRHVEAQHFGHSTIISVASGDSLSAAVTEEGTLSLPGRDKGWHPLDIW